MELEKAPLRFAFVSCFPLLQASIVGPITCSCSERTV